MKNKCRRFLVLLLGAFLWRATAQPIIAPETGTQIMTPAQEENTNAMRVFLPNGVEPLRNDDPLHWGPVTFRPHVDYSFLYGTGLQISPGNGVDSIVQTISPGLRVDFGRHWTIDYTPSLVFYSNDKLKDAVNHSAFLTGDAVLNDWGFSVSQNYSYFTEPNTQTASQSHEEDFGTALGASYFINSKLTANFGVNQNLQYVNELLDSQNSRDWSVSAGLNYKFGPRLNVGFNASAGYVNIGSGGFASPDQIYESFQLQANWRAADKISFQVQGGVEDRQYLGVSGQNNLLLGFNGTNIFVFTNHISPASDLLTPVFSAVVQYEPFRYTQISLSGGRSVSPSLFLNEVSENTTVGVSLSQRLLKKYHLDISANYNLAKYTSSLDPSQASVFDNGNRRDNTYIASVRLSRNFIKRGTWSIFYLYNKNVSNVSGYAYDSSQVGVEIGYRY